MGSGFRYFYSMDEIRAFYDKGKKKIPPPVSRSKSTNRSRTSAFVKYKSNKKLSDVARTNVTGVKDWIKDKFSKEKPPAKEPDYKYIKKIKVGDNTRYFYSDEEYQAYLKRKEYYANEPDFMKKFKKSEDPYTAQEDAILVNPKFKSWNTDYQTNCAECTAIYELRRRGYDVESNGVSGEPNAWAWWKRLYVEPEQAYKYNTAERYKQFYKDPVVQEVNTNNWIEPHEYSKRIEDTIKKNPPGSRGDISVNWTDGGGHSMVWERDQKGKVHIYDAQVSGSGSRIEYDLNELAKYCKPETRYKGNYYYTEIVRTDNLQLNKGITKICKNSDSNKQGVSEKKVTNPTLAQYESTEWSDKELQTQYPILYQEERRK